MSDRPEHIMAMAKAHYDRRRQEAWINFGIRLRSWEELPLLDQTGELMAMESAVDALEQRGSGLR